MSGSASGSASGRTVFASGDPDPILTNPPPGWKWVIEYQDYLIDADDLGEVCEVALVCCPPPVGPPPNPSGTGGSGTFSGGTSGNGSGTSSGGGGGSSGGGTGTGSGGDGYCFCGSHDFAITGGGGGGSSGGSGTFGTGDPTGSGSGDDDCEEVEDDPNSPPLWWLQIFRVLTCNAFYLDPNVCTCVQFYIDHPRPDGTYGPSSPQPCDSIYWPVILAAWQAFLQQHPGGTLLHCLGVDIPASYGPPVSDLKYIDVEFVGRKIGKSYCRDLEDCECP